jgi:hypothetical protein
VVRAEGISSDAIQVAGQPTDARKYLHRGNVQVRTLATPSLNDGVDLVPGPLAGHTRSLVSCLLGSFAVGVVQVRACRRKATRGVDTQGRRGRDTGSYVD